MKITIRCVNKNEKDILFRLLQFSLYEESATDGNEMNEQGFFDYEWFEKYFTEKDRVVFFIEEKEEKKILGFAMINEVTKYSVSGHSIAEFMVLPKYRRNKIGEQAAVMCFERFSGHWEVTPSLGSETAERFWKYVISKYTNNEYTVKGSTYVFENEEAI